MRSAAHPAIRLTVRIKMSRNAWGNLAGRRHQICKKCEIEHGQNDEWSSPGFHIALSLLTKISNALGAAIGKRKCASLPTMHNWFLSKDFLASLFTWHEWLAEKSGRRLRRGLLCRQYRCSPAI